MDNNKDLIKKILRENVTIVEDNKEQDPDKEKATPGQYERIQRLLANNIFNHAGIMEKLWGDSNSTQRSLFGKKLHKDKNDEGSTYEFSKEEVAKIMSILHNTSNDINQAIDMNKGK